MEGKPPVLGETPRAIAIAHLEQLKDMELTRTPPIEDRESVDVSASLDDLITWSRENKEQIANAVQNRKYHRQITKRGMI